VYALETFNSDVAVLDDGFQHLSLKRDVDIVLLSGKEDHMFPLGILREPVSALNRADILVLNSNEEFMSDEIRDFLSSHEHYSYRSSPVSLLGKTSEDPPLDPSHLKGLDVLLVSAIANPERFRKMSQALGWNVVDHLVFRDHHKYDPEDLSNILATANGKNIIFTEKDWVKLPHHFRERDGVFFLKIGVEFENPERFLDQLLNILNTHGPQS
jgi:tetraacyldisaccharide 4'-kinase